MRLHTYFFTLFFPLFTILSLRRRTKRVLWASISSSSSCGFETISSPVGRWDSGAQIAPSVAAGWWIHSAWTLLLALPAGVWNRVYASFWFVYALGTTEHLVMRMSGATKRVREREREREREQRVCSIGLHITKQFQTVHIFYPCWPRN